MKLDRHHLLTIALAAGALVHCECGEVEEFIPGGTFTPSPVLDFGAVAVTSEKTLAIDVLSDGRAALILSSLCTGANNDLCVSEAAADDFSTAKFRLSVDPELLVGLRPGTTSSISVTYRPCPEAWMGDQVDRAFMFDNCPTTPDQVPLNIVDNTRDGGRTITLSGQPAQAPVLEVACAQGLPAAMRCNMPDAQLITPCVSLPFENVVATDGPCDLHIEVKNRKRGGKLTGELVITQFEMLAASIEDLDTLRDGAELGFSIVDASGNAVTIDADNPLTVAIPQGADEGSVRLRARYTGQVKGIYVGNRSNSGGLRIYSNDPDQSPAKTVSVSGTGATPLINAQPTIVQYGPVPQGFTKTATVIVSNDGNAPLTISDIRFAQDTTNQKFRWTSDRGSTLPIVLESLTINNQNRMALYVAYTPNAGGQDADTLIIGSNDPVNNPIRIPITGGAVPRARYTPGGTLVFALPNPAPPPPIPPRTEPLEITNVGFGDLNVMRLRILGPGGDAMHSSVNDFSLDICNGATECTLMPPRSLCSPNAAGCMNNSLTINVSYQNDDASQTDLAELHISTNDPSDPEHVVVLSAQDVPCFFPTPVITVTSSATEVGSPVSVTGNQSSPGGAPGGGAMITNYRWFWLFTPGPQPPFDFQGTVNTAFTPTSAGVHILGLELTNDCGAMSQTPANENITISP